MDNKYKKFFSAFNIMFDILLLLIVVFLTFSAFYVDHLNNLIRLDTESSIPLYKRLISWDIQVFSCFVSAFISIFIVWLTRFIILLINKNFIFYCIFPIFNLKDIKYENKSIEINRQNTISFIVVLCIASTFMIINSFFWVFININI
ncbi:hypothetical protein DMC14_000195 [Metamycoplasma phocicerebrale]|uniref:Uncharacterized protein n=1 Tax=Metamycoplasma phocicerebrale TaxID=142649 RepID=A0A3T0TT22_9BACT|nr:hypothetical protein [Metamycoplasma phocicerebrale]AZZ65235.1 hypothetical protein DMC14_000195 [Metamycoplasma phocicerebrale]